MTAKVCSKCKKEKPLDSFHKGKGYRFGVKSTCKVCCKFIDSERYSEKKDQISANNLRWKKENPEKVKEIQSRSRQKNQVKRNETLRSWRVENPDKVRQHQASRRASKLNATPDWLTGPQKAHIARTYTLAKLMEDITNAPHHVDHIVPLQGENICGLHVPWNLQVLPARDNLRKGNRLC